MYKNTKIRLQAHRGVMREAPENTLSAFRLAAEQGYEIIELDPRFTRDGVCVLMHDVTVNRTARRGGEVLTEQKAIPEMLYSEFGSLEVGSWFDRKFTGEPVPTLPQVLTWAGTAGIEIRLDRKFEFAEFPQIFDIVDTFGKGVKISIGNCDLDALKIFADRYPTAPINYDGAYSEEAAARLLSFADPAEREVNIWLCPENNPFTAWCKFPKLTAEIAESVRSHGFGLGIWDIDTEEQMNEILPFEPDIVETLGGIKSAR